MADKAGDSGALSLLQFGHKGIAMIITRKHALEVLLAMITLPLFGDTVQPVFANELEQTPVITVDYMSKEIDTPTPYTQLSTSFSLVEKKELPRITVNKGSLSVAVTATCPKDGSFFVSLYKGATNFGTASFKRNGYTKATWNNLSTGSYTIRFSKTNDGVTVTCKEVIVF